MAVTEAIYPSRGDGRSPLRTRIAMMSCILMVLTSLAVAAPDAWAATPQLLLGRNKVGEYQPVRGDTYLAWQQNTRQHPKHYDVFARPLAGGDKFKVNAAGDAGSQRRHRRRRAGLSAVQAEAIGSQVLRPRYPHPDVPACRRQHRSMGVLAELLRRLALVRASVRERRSQDLPVRPFDRRFPPSRRRSRCWLRSRARTGERGLGRVVEVSAGRVRRHPVPHPGWNPGDDPEQRHPPARTLGGPRTERCSSRARTRGVAEASS